MKIWRVALNTYRGLLRNRALLAVVLLFLFIFLSSVGAIYYSSRLAEAGAAEQSRRLLALELESLFATNAVFAILLAALAGAFVLPGEIKTGTILPTLGRALPRSQYLLGLFLGVNLLLVTYLGLVSLTAGALLARSGVNPGWHLLLGLAYVILIANIVTALAFFFSTFLSPFVALVATGFLLELRNATAVVTLFSQSWGQRAERVTEYLLPAWGLLNFGEYLSVTRSPVARPAEFYFLGVGHAVDYLVVVLLLAYLVFRRRSLLPPS